MSNSISRFLRIFRGKLTSDLDANNNKILSLGAPATATDAATKAYVDGKATWGEIAGKPITFPPEYPSGGAVGNVLTKTATGAAWAGASSSALEVPDSSRFSAWTLVKSPTPNEGVVITQVSMPVGDDYNGAVVEISYTEGGVAKTATVKVGGHSGCTFGTSLRCWCACDFATGQFCFRRTTLATISKWKVSFSCVSDDYSGKEIVSYGEPEFIYDSENPEDSRWKMVVVFREYPGGESYSQDVWFSDRSYSDDYTESEISTLSESALREYEYYLSNEFIGGLRVTISRYPCKTDPEVLLVSEGGSFDAGGIASAALVGMTTKTLGERIDAKITNPSGGAAGNVLKKTASGVEWGEATDYTALTNKPQINSHELVGNQTLAALGIEAAGAAATAKTEAIAAAASDATAKANAAEAAAKTYADGKLAWQTVALADPEGLWEQPFTRVTVAKNTVYNFDLISGYMQGEQEMFTVQIDLRNLTIGDEFAFCCFGDGWAMNRIDRIEFINGAADDTFARLAQGESIGNAMSQTTYDSPCEMYMTFKVVGYLETGETQIAVCGGQNNYCWDL